MRKASALAAALVLLGPPARAAWDFEAYLGGGVSLFGANNKQFNDFYTSIFTLDSDASGSIGAFIPLDFELWLHYDRFGIGYYGGLELNGPGSQPSGTDYYPPEYREYWYFDGYGGWAYESYYDPGGYVDWSYGIGLSQTTHVLMFEYRLPIQGAMFERVSGSRGGGGLAIQAGIGGVKVHGTIGESDSSYAPNSNWSYGFDGQAPMYIIGLSFGGYDKSVVAANIELQYRTATVKDLRYETGARVIAPDGSPLEIGYSGVYIIFNFGIGFGFD